MAEKSLLNAWKEYVSEGRGLHTESRKQVEAFVKRLVREGELRSDQVQGAVDEIQKRSEKTFDAIAKRVRQTIGDELERIGVATRKDVDRLERDIAKLKKQMDGFDAGSKASRRKPNVKASAKKPATKKPATKKPAAKKPTSKTVTAKKSSGAAKKPGVSKASATKTKRPPSKRAASSKRAEPTSSK